MIAALLTLAPALALVCALLLGGYPGRARAGAASRRARNDGGADRAPGPSRPTRPGGGRCHEEAA